MGRGTCAMRNWTRNAIGASSRVFGIRPATDKVIIQRQETGTHPNVSWNDGSVHAFEGAKAWCFSASFVNRSRSCNGFGDVSYSQERRFIRD